MGGPLPFVYLHTWLGSQSVLQDSQRLGYMGVRNPGLTSQGLGAPATYGLLGKCALSQSDSFCLESKLKAKFSSS